MDAMDNFDEQSSHKGEDRVTSTIERYTGSIPSTAYLGIAIGAMALSLIAQMSGRGKWGNFIAQWVPTWLIIGLYNKLVKVNEPDTGVPGIGDGSRRIASRRVVTP